MDSFQDPARSVIPKTENDMLQATKRGLPCPAKTDLLNVYVNATQRYTDAVDALAKKIGTVPRDDYEKLRVASEKARRVSLEALERLDAHSHEHGC
jgi:hypothetical protein